MERFSDLDAVFLAGETPTQHLHVLATLVLDRSALPGRGGYELFQSRISERFHLIEPLRRRVRHVPFGPPAWIDDPEIHLQRHLHHIVLPDGGGLEALARTASDIASYPLPKDRPLWEAWFVEGMEKDQMAVIAKIHHCAVDGVSGIFALAAFFDLEPFPDAPVAPPEWEPAGPPRPVDVGRAVLHDLARRPQTLARGLRRTASSAVALARTRGGEVPLPFTGPRLSYNRALTARRSVAFTSVHLDDVRKIKAHAGGSVNDVLVALCAGVLRRYAIIHDELPNRPLIAGVPVSERTAEHGSAGNQLSFMFYGLPVHLEDPGQRLSFVTRSAAAVKDIYARAGQGLFAGLASLAPTSVVGPLMRALSGTHAASVLPPAVNVLISNIRGPDLPLFVAGAELSSIYPMGPLMEGVGLGMTVVSYRDEVAFGFMACSDLVPDIDELSTGIHLEVARMLDVVAPPG
jgi:diacylglycerol O-acyltransferase / wax synthase